MTKPAKNLEFDPAGFEDFAWWIEKDRKKALRIVKLIKDTKLKVQTQVQGEQVRVTGKKRDDLQQVISLLRAADYGLPLQYINFRD